MPEPIADLSYWHKRLEQARKSGVLHHAIYRCPLEEWRRIEERHRELLAQHVRPYDYILDCGCGWGRLLDLLPSYWQGTGAYLGIDLSPDFIELARREHPGRCFCVGDLRNIDARLDGEDKLFAIRFDIAVLISIKPMVIRNMGQAAWEEMEKEIKRHARRILYLEYDENDKGELVETKLVRADENN